MKIDECILAYVWTDYPSIPIPPLIPEASLKSFMEPKDYMPIPVLGQRPNLPGSRVDFYNIHELLTQLTAFRH